MAHRRVLVVDADWKMRRLIRTNLEAQGLEVTEADSGRGCLQALQAPASCDLLLLSIELPDGNGWNLVAALRCTPAGRDLPIIAIAAEPVRHRLLQRFQRISPLIKPFSASDLLERVDWALQNGEQTVAHDQWGERPPKAISHSKE